MRTEKLRVGFTGVGVLTLLLGIQGCGGGGASPPQADGPAIQTPSPPITTDRGEVFNVTITTNGGQLLVDKLEIEFNSRKGIHELYGFFFDAYSEMERIPFADLKRIDFRGQMPQVAFEQAIIGREDQRLHLSSAFEVQLTYWDEHQESFYAFIPMLRGEKDLTLWEYSMDSANTPILYIEFDR